MNPIPPILQYIPHYIWTKVINNCGAAIAYYAQAIFCIQKLLN